MSKSTQVRSVFISDSHLGFRYANAEALLEFLKQHDPEHLYLVGDFLDGWRLKTAWYWPETYSQIVDRIFELIRSGTKVYYTPGNHDDFLREQIPEIYPVKIADEFKHLAADGRVYCVIHGDLFDAVETNSKWLSGVGTRIYNIIMGSNKGLNACLKFVRLPEFNYAFLLKRFSKRCVGLLNRYQLILYEHARTQGCDGIICGHNHLPRLKVIGDIVYANTGDWVEHTSAIVEYSDGSLVLFNKGKRISELESRISTGGDRVHRPN